MGEDLQVRLSEKLPWGVTASLHGVAGEARSLMQFKTLPTSFWTPSPCVIVPISYSNRVEEWEEATGWHIPAG